MRKSVQIGGIHTHKHYFYELCNNKAEDIFTVKWLAFTMFKDVPVLVRVIRCLANLSSNSYKI